MPSELLFSKERMEEKLGRKIKDIEICKTCNGTGYVRYGCGEKPVACPNCKGAGKLPG